MSIISFFPNGNGGGSGIPLPSPSITGVIAGSKTVLIKWTDPEDVIVDGVAITQWKESILRRKLNSPPENQYDGDLVVSTTTRNRYSNNYFTDSDVENGEVYYYRVFAKSTDRQYSISSAVEVSPYALDLSNWQITVISSTAAGDGKISVRYAEPPSVKRDDVVVASCVYTQWVFSESGYVISPFEEGQGITTITQPPHNIQIPMLFSGLTNGLEYYVTVFAFANSEEYGTPLQLRLTPNKVTVSIPNAGTSVYTGSTITPTWTPSNYSNYCTLEPNSQTQAVDAGSYLCWFTPKQDYMWTTGNSNVAPVYWTISKANPMPTITSGGQTISEVNLSPTNTSQSVFISYNGYGAVSGSSNNGNVTLVQDNVNPKIFLIQNLNQVNGSATVTFQIAESTNYSAAAVQLIVNCQFLPEQKSSFNDYTWDEIKQIIDAGAMSEYGWQIGDYKECMLTTGAKVGDYTIPSPGSRTYGVRIIGIEHEGISNSVDFGLFFPPTGQYGYALIDGSYDTYVSNGSKVFNVFHTAPDPESTDIFWYNSDIRYDILGSTNEKGAINAPLDSATNPVANTLMAALPSDLRAVMSPLKYFDIPGLEVTDFLPLLDWDDLVGSQNERYDYYKVNSLRKDSLPGHSTSVGNLKYYLREQVSQSNVFYLIQGTAFSTASSNFVCGIAPVFRIGGVSGSTVKSLRIGSDIYWFEQGQTWGQWVNSSYNSGNFYVSNGVIWKDSYTLFKLDNMETMITDSMVIDINSQYYTDETSVQFYAADSFTLSCASPGWDTGKIKVWRGGSTWEAWDGSVINAILVNQTYRILLRGYGNTRVGGSSSSKCFVFGGTSNNIKMQGDLRALLTFNGLDTNLSNIQHYTFGYLFYGQTRLTGVSYRINELYGAEYAYHWCFHGCTGLTTIPTFGLSLQLTVGCFSGMFVGCSSLRSVGSTLYSTFLPSYCYQNMFAGCTNLIDCSFTTNTITLSTYSCYRMFYNCISLTTPPSINTTNIPFGACREMFMGCTSLVDGSSILGDKSFTVGEKGCYEMFQNCTSLTGMPKLYNMTQVGVHGCYRMFKGCTSLTTITNLYPTILPEACYYEMFYNTGVSLTTTANSSPYRIPTVIIDGGSAESSSLTNMFSSGVTTPNAFRQYYINTGSLLYELSRLPASGLYISSNPASGSTYNFVTTNPNYLLASSNGGVHNSTAGCEFSVNGIVVYGAEIKYKVSSEANYDLLTITFNGFTYVDKISGQNEGTIIVSPTATSSNVSSKIISPSHFATGTFKITYSKDSSQNSYEDLGAIVYIEIKR